MLSSPRRILFSNQISTGRVISHLVWSRYSGHEVLARSDVPSEVSCCLTQKCAPIFPTTLKSQSNWKSTGKLALLSRQPFNSTSFWTFKVVYGGAIHLPSPNVPHCRAHRESALYEKALGWFRSATTDYFQERFRFTSRHFSILSPHCTPGICSFLRRTQTGVKLDPIRSRFVIERTRQRLSQFSPSRMLRSFASLRSLRVYLYHVLPLCKLRSTSGNPELGMDS